MKIRKIKNREEAFKLLSTVLNSSKKAMESVVSFVYESEYLKGEYLVKLDEKCDKIFFIKKGIIRSFVPTGRSEITKWINCEGDFITSITGFFMNKPSHENIQALENSVLYTLDRKNLEKVYKNFPEFNEAIRRLLQIYYVQSEERNLITRLPHAKDKWNYLFNNLNKFINRIPLKYTASFLGIRLETLSRIRKLVS